jgi:thioredoxin reductase/Pyruvate/2-oxoacid:ferredoxin oxidoreductase delta subunit
MIAGVHSVYLLALVVILYSFLLAKRKGEMRSRAVKQAAIDAGLTEPTSLHPIIDPVLCLGCGTCSFACPEKDVLGVVSGKAELIDPSHCIGHGACRAACPVDAISLVFGTEKRGVDIPHVNPTFETNVPGIYIAGELGGMGLIRNAIEQGRQAMTSVESSISGTDGGPRELLDVVIVGAGPAGFSASLAAKKSGLRAVTLEQETLGGTVAHYPRGKLVMTAPAELPLYGKVKLTRTTKEELLALWQDVEAQTGVQINYLERVDEIRSLDQGFEVVTPKATYATRAVLLALGRRGTPRKLGVPGEDRSKVVYSLIDAEQYRGQRVLVVGGGDSALEAALSLSEQPNTKVTLSYRGEAFGRAKQQNRDRVQDAADKGQLDVFLQSNVKDIQGDRVSIGVDGGSYHDIENDAVIISAGGILPTKFLKDIGITVEMKHGTA